ncbi:MAG: ATP-binding protein [Thermoprotei archaeon]|nr:MAG: ATP-binding protein [Thermoprotei archaeon]
MWFTNVDYITVVRSEAKELENIRGWILLYGRRKVGKTFLLKNFMKWDAYIVVRRDLSLRAENIKINNIKEIPEKVGSLLEEERIVVIDEFQRLPESVLEDLTEYHPKGRLILSGSSLGAVRKIFEPKSPLLGFFTPYKLSLIQPLDILSALLQKYSPIKAVELASYLRDPWLIPLYGDEDITTFIYKYTCKYWQVVKALLGEVFAEEERTLTKIYEAIISLLGSRIWKIKEIANTLYTKGVISEPSSSHVSGFMKNLIEMDLVEAIKLYESRRKYYKLKSPIMETYYFLENKYDVSERQVSLSEVKPALEYSIRLQVEDYLADLTAQIYEGRREYSVMPEIDSIITVRRKIKAVVEVKWGNYSKKDLEKFYKKTETIPGEKIFITRKKEESLYKTIKIIDAEDLATQVKSIIETRQK